MDSFISGYSALVSSAVAGIQKVGVLSIPLVIVLGTIINYFGGEKALRAVGVTVAVVAVLAIILSNAVALGNWISKPVAPAAPPATTPAPAALQEYRDWLLAA